MAVWQLWLFSFAALLLLRVINLSINRRWGFAIPWRICGVAIFAQALAGSLPNQSGIALTNELLRAMAFARLLLWFGLELLPRWRLLPANPKILRDLLFVLISGLLLVIVLQQRAKIDLVGLLTTSAVLTAVIGLAAQEPLKDLLGGLSLQLEQVLREGDWIEVGGLIGRVQSISWRDTELRCIDGSKLVMPNARVTAADLRNFSGYGPYANRIFIGLDYSFSPGQAKALMLQLAHQHPLVLSNPTPLVRLAAFDDSAIRYEWLVWQASYGQSLGLRSDLLEQLWYALDRQGQSIPYPIRDLRISNSSELIKATDLNEVEKLLEETPLFDSLSAPQLHRLIEQSQCQSYGNGETVVAEGDEGDSLFVVCHGRMAVTRMQKNGKVLTIAELKRGDLFGEMTLCTGESRSATVRADGEVRLLEIDRIALASLLSDDPDLINRIGLLVSQRQAHLQQLEESAAKAQQQDLLLRMQKLFKAWLQ
jgi:small-conductance mechanosensitive channel/CRP-like cAMP-binding protein